VSNRPQDRRAVLVPQRHHRRLFSLLVSQEKDISDLAKLFFDESLGSINYLHPSCTLSETALLPIVVCSVICVNIYVK
jgi:hypothetical protein